MKLESAVHKNVNPDGSISGQRGHTLVNGGVNISIPLLLITHVEKRTDAGIVRVNTYQFTNLNEMTKFLESHLKFDYANKTTDSNTQHIQPAATV